MRRVGAIVVAALVGAALAGASTADASKRIQKGINDDTQILYGNPDEAFPSLATLGTQLIRATLWWGGPNGVATRKPANPANPADPAYNWDTYDRTVSYALRYRMAPVLTVLGTPSWASRSKAWNVAPTNPRDLQLFATAAARRYSGTYRLPDGTRLGRVAKWVAWNEPNNPVFLRTQFVRSKGKWVIQSGIDYAKICNAVVKGVKSVNRTNKIACGVTAPRGNNQPGTIRSSIAPLAFLRSMKLAGAKGFDAYAHHPYYGGPSETPNTKPPQGRRGQPTTAVTLGNFEALTTELSRLYGKAMRIWVTEYGYQTNPPDRVFGISLKLQAIYMQQAWDKLAAHPRVDMMIWFLLRDEGRVGPGWQSGLFTVGGKRKPSREVFERLVP